MIFFPAVLIILLAVPDSYVVTPLFRMVIFLFLAVGTCETTHPKVFLQL
jgi:hypothetical protein